MTPRKPLLPDTPGVTAVSAAVTLILAVIVFIAALPDEERVLVHEGREVAVTDTCAVIDEDGRTVEAPCVEVGHYETRETGWLVPGVVASIVLAALAAVVLAALPAQIREQRQKLTGEFAEDEDDRRGR